jgi:Transposase and inactivated derivatives, IS30 family
MKSYSHFTQMDICCLFYLLHLGTSQAQIARALNKHRSSVSRLIKRCPGGKFNPEVSYENYLENRKKCIRKHRVQKGTELFEFIREKLYKYWSPEIIALKWNEEHKDESISFNTIYSTIKNGVFEKISAQTHLRRRGKQKYGHRSQYCTIKPDKTIHDLPEEAKYRERLNDWEGDTIRTTPGKGCIVTLLDRKSRFLLAKSVDKVSSEKVCNAIREAFNENGIHPKTIVFDNGSEFAKFRELERDLQTSIYFADLHSPWQRGSNENINDCLRFFLPRGMDFRNLDDGYLENAVSLLNNRPRKCLGLKSPHEVYCCT